MASNLLKNNNGIMEMDMKMHLSGGQETVNLFGVALKSRLLFCFPSHHTITLA